MALSARCSNTAITLLIAATMVRGQQADRRVGPVDGGRRLALVIGNAAYTSIDRLLNPINDARAVAATLKTVGFADRDVRLVIDAPREEMRRSVRGFVESVKRGDLAFVYYAGHGVEVKGTNYLLPVDVPRDATEGYVEDEAVSAQRLLRDLDNQGAQVRILVLDACRDNPLRASRSAGGGLAPMEGKGSLVVFSTEAGRTASDTPGQTNSVFTRYLVEGLKQPGVSIDDAMKRVSRNVARATGERQIPAIYGLLLDDVILVSVPSAAPVTPTHSVVPSSGKLRLAARLNPKDGVVYKVIPAHEDKKNALKAFLLAETEVTQNAYQRVMGSNPSAHRGEKLPVEQVTWEEARKYCQAIGGRLPTAGEWDWADRMIIAIEAGKVVVAWNETSWNAANSGNETHEVGKKRPNQYGLFDMLGNVWEWVDDGEPGPSHGLRGGSLINPPPLSLSTRSDPAVPKTSVVGFRCALDE